MIVTFLTNKDLRSFAVLCDINGQVATCSDAGDHEALNVVSTITAVQSGEGDPSPDNVRPITGWSAVNLYHAAAYDTSVAADETVTLPETVYGGTLDWTTGLLTVTMKQEEISSAEGLYMNVGEGYIGATVTREEMAVNSRANGYCDKLLPVNSPATKTSACVSFGANNSNIYMVLSQSLAGTTLEEFNAYLADNPVTVVYPLATPYTIQLDPYTLTMLEGNNALWSDTGDTAVTYIADAKLYIDAKLAAL